MSKVDFDAESTLPLAKSRVVRFALFIIGWLAIGLGTLGIFLPLLPTTPFFLLAVFCFLRSSKTCYERLMKNQWFQQHILPYMNKQGIPLKSKLTAIALIWSSIGFCIFVVVNSLVLKLLLFSIALSVSIYLWRQPTPEKNNDVIN